MPKVLKIDRVGLDTVKAAILKALAPIEAELGVTFSMGRGKYGNAEKGSTEIEFVCAAPDGTSRTIGEIDFRRHAAALGLKPDDFGRTLKSQGETYTISGLVASSRKYPIMATRPDGKAFKFTVDTVSLAFKAEDEAAAAAKRAELEKAEADRNAENKRVLDAAAEAKARKAAEEAEKAEDDLWVAPPRQNRISDAAKAMQDRLFG